MNIRALLPLLLSINVLSGCVTSRVDEMVFNEPEVGIGEATAVILGRRHGSDYATEPDFVRCVGSHIMKKDPTITIIPETYFLDDLYPWFEPRTAPRSGTYKHPQLPTPGYGAQVQMALP